MKRLADTALTLCLAALACGGAAWPEERSLDLAGITLVDISGAASTIRLETSQSGPQQATVGNRWDGWFSGWYSSWFFDDCGAMTRMRIEGSRLMIEAPPASWFDRSDCTADIRATLPPGTAVSIAQSATQARLSGDFSAVTIESKAADIDLRGHADDVSVRGDALRVNLVYDRTDKDEVVRLDGRLIEADLDFGGVPAIDYAVEAKASWVTHTPELVPGARPLLRIKGDLVHATVR
jgi:hypothetical protein